METIFLRGRLIFLFAVATLFLGIILWKRLKRKSWVIEEFIYNPVLNPEDLPLSLYMGWTPVAYFPFSLQYFPETLIKDGSLDAAEITRKRVFEYSTLAEYQEFTDRVIEAQKKKPERGEEKEPYERPAVRPLNEWINLEHGERPLWAKFFFMFIAILSVVIFVRMIWAFLTFPY
jgi:hypothetical protein